MTEFIDAVPKEIATRQLAQQLVEQARAEGIDLVGRGGLLTGLTKTVLETALNAEMAEHLGYDHRAPSRVTSATHRLLSYREPQLAPQPTPRRAFNRAK